MSVLLRDAYTWEYIGGYLQEVREHYGVLVEDAAAAAGVSTSSLRQYEKGRQAMSLVTFIRLCVCYGIDPARGLGDIMQDNTIKVLEK